MLPVTCGGGARGTCLHSGGLWMSVGMCVGIQRYAHTFKEELFIYLFFFLIKADG